MAIKEIYIVNSSGTMDSENIGAEAENIEVSKDSDGNITTKDHQVTSEPLHVLLNKLQKTEAFGARNLLKCNFAIGTTYKASSDSTATLEGVINSDFSVTLNGIASSTLTDDFLCNYDDANTLSLYEIELPAGNYKLSGCPSGGSDSTYYLDAYVNGSSVDPTTQDVGDGMIFSLDSTATIKIYGFVNIGIEMTDVTFKPMITLASEINSDYNHYSAPAMSNSELSKIVSDVDETPTENSNKLITSGAVYDYIDREIVGAFSGSY